MWWRKKETEHDGGVSKLQGSSTEPVLPPPAVVYRLESGHDFVRRVWADLNGQIAEIEELSIRFPLDSYNWSRLSALRDAANRLYTAACWPWFEDGGNP